MPQLNKKYTALFLGSADDGLGIYAAHSQTTGSGTRTVVTNVCLIEADDGQPDLSGSFAAGTVVASPAGSPGPLSPRQLAVSDIPGVNGGTFS